MKKIVLVFCIVLAQNVISQELLNDSIYRISEIDIKPEFISNDGNVYKYLVRVYRVPNKRKFEGQVIIEFIVEKDGTLTNMQIIKDPGFGSGDELIRVMKLSPLWKPGERKGQKIRTLYSLPLTVKSAR